MLKNDTWIFEQASQGMIKPFEVGQVRKLQERPVISYGVSSYGYDIRLSPNDFRVFQRIPGKILDPKSEVPEGALVPQGLAKTSRGEYFIIPGNSYALGVSLERFKIPRNITTLCVGKSTYARCGIIANVTPAEAEWEGHLTLEFSNSSPSPCRMYANEGVVQLLFLEGEPCQVSYGDRNGKYQNQPESVVLAKM